ncbi:MAG: cupin domain-containing protein [Phycisphaerae bacterium]|nr:cupin domain-containing protein [Phycisphaerae bacterium]MDD5380073.1 cupin domain-containing protein [Phycisphaerae bacterium]
MSIEKKDAAVLDVCFGRNQELVSLIKYSDDSVVSKTIVDTPAGTITLFAFDKGQKLSEHTAPYNAVVQVIEGTARLMIGGRDVTVPAGHVIIMPANVPHAVNAEERFKMLLTMIRTQPKAV